MDRTGKRHMARRADDCKPNLECKPPACSAATAVLDYGESGHAGAIRLTDRRIPFRFLHDAGQTHAAVRGPH